MGSSAHTSLNKEQQLAKYESSIEFIAEKNTPHFGPIKIYKMLEKPYEYLMRKTYSGLSNNQKLYKKYEWYRTMDEDKNSVSLDFIKLIEREGPCGKSIELSIFCKYYYFTLADAIAKKLKKQQYFLEEEVFYVVETLLHLYRQFHRANELYLGFFKTKSLFLTPQGFLKAYPFITAWAAEYYDETQDTKYKLPDNLYHSDQISVTLSAKQVQDKANNQRQDLQDIGIAILELMTLTKTEDYYNESGAIKYDFVQYILNSWTNKKSLGAFKQLVKGLIEGDLGKTEEQVRILKESPNFKPAFCLKLCSIDSQQTSEITEKQENWEQFKKQKLSRMPKQQLVAGRVRSISFGSPRRE